MLSRKFCKTGSLFFFLESQNLWDPEILAVVEVSDFHDLHAIPMILTHMFDSNVILNPLSANPTKWSNTLKQFVGKLPMNCLNLFDHFVRLALKGLKTLLSIPIKLGFQTYEDQEYLEGKYYNRLVQK